MDVFFAVYIDMIQRLQHIYTEILADEEAVMFDFYNIN